MGESRKGNWGVWLGVVAIFVFGAVTGVLGAAFYVHHLVGHTHSRGPRAFEEVALQLLDWELGLDDAQEAAVAEIIHEVHLDLMEFKSRHADEIDTVLRGALARIGDTLTEAQRDDWSALRARMEAAHEVGPGTHGSHGEAPEHPH